MKSPQIRVNLNERSTQQLLAVMAHYKVQSPTHMVQTMITELYQSIPVIEENIYGSTEDPQDLSPL